ncbi:MAG: alpha-L-fucosidase [Planctomycetota bacterium]
MTYSIGNFPWRRCAPLFFFVLIGVGLLSVAAPTTHAADPPRMKRADAFLGVHFDFHAGEDCNQVGARTTPEMVELVIDKVNPDYIQIDCKGHRGYSSYPTKVGNPAPGFVGDPLKTWRQVTRERGVALFMHYSGVWDYHAVATHPEWAAVKANGEPHRKATSVFGPYVDELMIPQLRELAGEYKVDGVWVDGDCWGTVPDYGEKAVRQFCQQSGAKSAPRSPDDPYWHEWMSFHREGYRRYLRHYVNELKASHPDFQVISNWAFSDHMPEPVSADVASLSGDFSPDNSVNSARFAGRCLEDQGVPWDLMSWSFSRKTRKQKPAIQLMQEASVVLALGAGYQAYFKQDRDGAIRNPEEMDVMAKVAQFCRDRQPYCHRSVAVPQIALLYSTAGHYRESPRLFHWAGSHGVTVLRKALTQILQHQYGVQIVSEHHLRGKMDRWPVIIVPGWKYISGGWIFRGGKLPDASRPPVGRTRGGESHPRPVYLEPDFRDELARYAKSGGRLLLIGPGPAELFEEELNNIGSIVTVDEIDDTFSSVIENVFPTPVVEVGGSRHVDVSPRRLNGQLSIHLVNTSGPHANAPDGGIHEIDPVGPLTVSIRLKQAPESITMQPNGQPLDMTWNDGQATVTVEKVDLYSILMVESAVSDEQ